MAATALTLARNGVRRGFRSRSLVLLGVVGPLALGTVLALAFGGRGPTIGVGLVDLDRSELSAGVGDGLARALEGSQVELDRLDPPPGGELGPLEQQVADGEVGALLVIPEGWAASLAAGPSPLRVVEAGDNAIAGSVAESIAGSISSGTDLQRAVATALATAGVAPPGGAPQGLVEPVISATDAEFEGAFDAALYFGPLAVFLFLGLGVSARALLRDEHDGILDRVRAAPVSSRDVVGGSSLTVVAQGLLASLVVIVVSSVVFGATWGQPLEVAVVVVAFVVAAAGMLGLIVGVARTELQAESWTNVVAFTFAVIGGSFFGGALLPGVLGVLGTLTPNGAAMRALIEVGPGGRSLLDIWYLLLWMLVVGVGGVVVGGRLLTRRLR